MSKQFIVPPAEDPIVVLDYFPADGGLPKRREAPVGASLISAAQRLALQSGRLAAVLAAELVHAAGGIDNLLLAGEERMAA